MGDEQFAKSPWRLANEALDKTNAENYNRQEIYKDKQISRASQTLGIAEQRLRLADLHAEIVNNVGKRKADLDIANETLIGTRISNNIKKETEKAQIDTVNFAAESARITSENREAMEAAQISLVNAQAANQSRQNQDSNKMVMGSAGVMIPALSAQAQNENKKHALENYPKMQVASEMEKQIDVILGMANDPGQKFGKGSKLITDVLAIGAKFGVPTAGLEDIAASQGLDMAIAGLTQRLIQQLGKGFTDYDSRFTQDTFGDRSRQPEALRWNMHLLKTASVVEQIKGQFVAERALATEYGIPHAIAQQQVNKFFGPASYYSATGLNADGSPITFDAYYTNAMQKGNSLEEVMNTWNYHMSIKHPAQQRRHIEKMKTGQNVPARRVQGGR